MATPEDLRPILEEIRDLERAHLEEYRRVTSQSLALQQGAVAAQRRAQRVVRIVSMAIAILIGFLLVVLVALLRRVFP